ncbi:hypothetical protein [Microcystis sp. M42BS1]|uniref:hypothetical protein n=1 Tax=Microcystis sp. M42BS1 TaxID=2771192 RepID=UPI002586DCEE|nr:hypothetical protein [Microcystis sp. M42BS1]MCA2570669.1 hypothetical protein [Microcystis sp. M42BS1]
MGGYLPTYLKEKLLKRGLNEFEVDSWYRHCPSWDCPAFVGFLPQYLELRTDRNPKVLSYGDKPFRPLAVNKHSDVVVLVEDAISAIKVARSGYAAMPLFGSKLGDYGGLRSVTIVWLDPDKTKEAFNLVDSLRSLGYTADVIPEFKQDPKDYSDSEIMNKLETVVSMQHVRNTLTKA